MIADILQSQKRATIIGEKPMEVPMPGLPTASIPILKPSSRSGVRSRPSHRHQLGRLWGHTGYICPKRDELQYGVQVGSPVAPFRFG